MPPFSILSISTLSGAWPSIWPAVIPSPCPIPLEKTIDQVRSRLFTGRSVHFRPRPMPLFSRVPAGSGRYPLFDLRPYPSPCFLLSSQLWGIRPAYPHEYPYPEIVTCIIFWVQTHQRTPILIQCRSSFFLHDGNARAANTARITSKSAELEPNYAGKFGFPSKRCFAFSTLLRSRPRLRRLDRSFPGEK